jgi:hypothetical protein
VQKDPGMYTAARVWEIGHPNNIDTTQTWRRHHHCPGRPEGHRRSLLRSLRSGLTALRLLPSMSEEGLKEAEERIVRLPDLPGNSATAFEDFHLYTGKVYSAIEGEVNRPNADGEWGRLVGAWILGEVLLSGSFKDAVSDAILDKLNTGLYYPTSLFCSAYKYGSANSAFRRLMVDIAVYHWDDDTMSKLHTERDQAAILPFYQSIAVALLQWKQQPEIAKNADSPTKLEGTCFYHEHGDKPCYKTMF